MGKMERIFGFDIGTTSIGWAVIDYDKDAGEGRIIAKDGVPGMGVRIFPEARDPDGTPLNQTRRQKRMMRRQLRRRKQRRRLLNEALTEAGLLPPFSKDKDSEWAKVMALDPYPLRARGVSEPLSTYEVGRAIYHLSKLRHFKGRDLEDDDDFLDDADPNGEAGPKPKRRSKTAAEGGENKPANGDDEKKLKEEIASTHKLLRSRGVTLGQYLAERKADATKGAPPMERRRQVHAHRVDVEAEFEALWTAQSRHHKQLDDAALEDRVRMAIFAQRPVFWRKATLGKCRFVPDAELCPRGSWLSQQRRMLEKLNNLAIVGGNARPLDEEERQAILAQLQTQGSMTWSSVRKILKPILRKKDQPEDPKFNLELEKGGTLLGNPLEAKLAAIFGDRWDTHPHKQAIRDAVHERLWSADYGEIGTQRVVIRSSADRRSRRAEAAQSFIADFGATPEQAAKLKELGLPTGWEPFSTAALKKILAELERGEPFGALVNAANDDKVMRTRENTTRETYGDWRNEHFPDRERPTGEYVDFLPSPASKEEQERINSLRNPTVVRVQNELRKVINNLIRVYGRPDLIRIELTRDIGKSKREREEESRRNRKKERERRKAAEDLKSKGIPDPSRDDIKKWVLWKECGEFDPYSGRAIDFDGLFRTGEFDVEHIWPEPVSLDSSLSNLTLCARDWNRRKHKRTPFEAFGNDPSWETMKARVWARVQAGAMGKGKAKRFCREEPLPEDFARRQLNDTGYAARQAVAFLKRLWPDVGPTSKVYVQPVSGKVTDRLRRYWELNNILSDDGEKTRADHRHHAVDALVVACAHPGVVNKLSRYLQAKDAPQTQRPRLDPPWPDIRRDAEKTAAEIVVSHRVRKKVSGPLHKETIYGDTGENVKAGKTTYRQFVTRKKVDVLTKGELDEIRDARVGTTIRDWVAAHGGDPKKAFATHPRLGHGGAEIRKVRLLIKQQMDLMAPVSTGYAAMGSNHHIAIWRLSTGETDFDVVTMFEATKRLARREPVFQCNRGDDSQFVMSLAPGDAVVFAKDDKSPICIWRVQKLSGNGQIYFVDHRDASQSLVSMFAPTVGGLMSRQGKKISVDPIGRVRPARD
jgi:CRISPR-associated endonuclease Csn1